MTDEQTDLDLIIDHAYQPTAWPDTCGHRYATGWPCGYSQDDHQSAVDKQ